MLIQSDAAQIPLPDKSIHCVTTSPPYWGLRKYSGVDGRGMFPNLGLEPTPQEFIQNMVMIFREVRRVLRDDGVVWLNLGDSFSGSGGPGNQWDNKRGIRGTKDFVKFDNPNRKPGPNAGNLMMMPHRVAIALQDDGWIVRNDVVWFKRNPMPESVNGWRFQRKREKTKDGNTAIGKLDREDGKASWTVYSGQGTRREGLDNPEYEYGEDYELRKGSWRHTRAHEFIFQLVKGPKMQYWSNQEAVRESQITPLDTKSSHTFGVKGGKVEHSYGSRVSGKNWKPNSSGRNPRSVLDIPTAPYKGAHYATFPPNLIAPLIRATCPRWACPVCGQGWSPVVEKGEVTGIPGEGGDGYQLAKAQSAKADSNIKGRSEGWTPNHFIPSNVKEYRPTCEHPHTIKEAVPGIVLDPFVGSGTSVQVAKQLLRRGVGLDISMDYLDEQAKIRTGAGSPSNVLDDLPMFAHKEE